MITAKKGTINLFFEKIHEKFAIVKQKIAKNIPFIAAPYVFAHIFI